MPLKAIVGGAAKDLTSMFVMKNGALKEVRRVDAWDGDEWKEAYLSVLPMTLSISPPHVELYYPASWDVKRAAMTTPSATAMPIGGRGPFTYSWSLTGIAELTAPNSASTQVHKARVNKRETFTGTITCTCRDSTGQVATASATWRLGIG